MLMSAFIVTLMALYALIATFALFMTHLEQRRMQNTSLFWSTLSFLACLCWPATFVVVAMAIVVQKNKATGYQVSTQAIPQGATIATK